MRYALAHLGIGEKVASLTTIATPHKGTYLADFVHSTQSIVRAHWRHRGLVC